MTNQSNTWIKQAFVKLRVSYGNCCDMCGSTESLEFAHTRDNGFSGMGRGRKERYYNIKNNPNDYRLLCKKCHRIYDKR